MKHLHLVELVVLRQLVVEPEHCTSLGRQLAIHCSIRSKRHRIPAISWALWASFNLAKADSIALFLSAGILSPISLSCFSVWKMRASAWFSLSIRSFSFASFSALRSLVFHSFDFGVGQTRLGCFDTYALFFTCTFVFGRYFKIPLASISNVTSIWGTPAWRRNSVQVEFTDSFVVFCHRALTLIIHGFQLRAGCRQPSRRLPIYG